MRQLALHDINLAHALLEPLAARHLAVHAVRHGQRPGSLWVDTLPSPCIVLVSCDLGWYLGGTPGQATDLIALGGLIPSTAYLIHDGPHWLAQFPLFLHNQVARPHPRIVLRRTLVPAEPYPAPVPYRAVPLDADDAALDASDRHALDRWLENDRGADIDTTLAGNIGHALFDGEQLLALCLTDLVANERAELGVWVMPEKRRQGLGRQVVQHVLASLARWDITEVGWHSLANNRPSLALAQRCGFLPFAHYAAHSALLPAESPDALSRAEYIDWALHYEAAREFDPWFRVLAAEAWALAGEVEQALANLATLPAHDWQPLLSQRWRLTPLRHDPRFAGWLRP